MKAQCQLATSMKMRFSHGLCVCICALAANMREMMQSKMEMVTLSIELRALMKEMITRTILIRNKTKRSITTTQHQTGEMMKQNYHQHLKNILILEIDICSQSILK